MVFLVTCIELWVMYFKYIINIIMFNEISVCACVQNICQL